MKLKIVSVVTGLALLATVGGVAEAAGPGRMGGRPAWSGQTGKGGHGGHHGHGGHSHFKVTDTAPSKVVIPHRHHHGFPSHHPGHLPGRPFYPGYFYGGYGYASTYVAPSYTQWVPGYWTYVWVPQGSSTNAWVPGYYDRDGVWVAGYHVAQTVQAGYYQPYWVNGYWVP